MKKVNWMALREIESIQSSNAKTESDQSGMKRSLVKSELPKKANGFCMNQKPLAFFLLFRAVMPASGDKYASCSLDAGIPPAVFGALNSLKKVLPKALVRSSYVKHFVGICKLRLAGMIAEKSRH